MKALFTHSYFLHRDKKQLKSATPYPPLAPLYAAALLRENGFDVRLADLQFATDPAEIKTHIERFQPDIFIVYDDAFNYLTKMCLTNMRDACFEMIGIAKQFNLPVIVSSPDATDHLPKYFTAGADYIILGEGEETLLELLRSIENGTGIKVSGIDGLAVRVGGEIVRSGARKVIRNLDQLPSPAWDLIDIALYRNIWMKHHGYFSLNFVTTRGCPYKCNWCAKPVYGNRYNSHSAARVVNEIALLQAKTGFTHIWFADDIFGLKPGFMEEFSAAIKKSGIQIRYKIQSRADLLTDEQTVKDLKESGCEEVWMGAESGSQKILDAMDKGTTIEEIARATALLKKYNIRPCYFLQFGYTGELMDDISETIRMTMRLKPYDIGISVSYPLPGTKFYEKVKADLTGKQNWTDSDDLQVMFRGTYGAEFYRHLQRFVHYKFRTAQALDLLKENKFQRRTALLPYYFLKQKNEKRKLHRFAPEAKLLLT